MIITTARKPSSKTRIFCKHLGRFTGWKYVNRGKTSLLEFGDKPLLLVGEYKGNPGSFIFFSNGRCVLSIRANVSLDKDIRYGGKPTIQGDVPLALYLSRLADLKIADESQRVIKINENIECICNGESYIKLTVLGVRGKGSV